jgi:tRNA pseudouridine55 synthase
LNLLDWQAPDLTFEVHCSKGTYIRTLAEDIAAALGSCAHLIELRRTLVEPFEHSPMLTLEQLQEARDNARLSEVLLPADAGLVDWPRIDLDAIQQGKYQHGQQIAVHSVNSTTGKVRVYDGEGRLLGLGEVSADRILQPTRVFNL